MYGFANGLIFTTILGFVASNTCIREVQNDLHECTNDYESPLGNILLAGDEQGLTGLWFTDGGRYIGLGLKKGAVRRETDYFSQTKEWLNIYFSGRDPGFLPRIHLVGSDFRNRVGEIMCEIPFGSGRRRSGRS